MSVQTAPGVDVPAWYQRILEAIDAGAHADAERIALDVEEYHRRRESELLALYETARDLSALRDTDRVLRAIVRRARQLLGSEVAYLSLFDAERQDFYVRSTEGSVSDAFAHMRAPLGVGVCGAIAVDKQPHFSSDYANDPAFRHDPGLDSSITGDGVSSILGVPLLAEDTVIGVLFVADRVSRAYTPQQIALLDSLGAHAAVAIENARLFQESQEAYASLQARSAEVQSAAEVHEQLTKLLARGGDLPDLAEVLERELRGRVTIVDDTLRPLTGDLALGEADLREAVRRSREAGHSVRVSGCTVAAVKQGGVVLERAEEPSPPEARTLERAAMMVALVLLARERLAGAEQRAMAELVNGLLKRPQEDLEALRREARRHGLDLDEPVAAIVMDVGRYRSAHTARSLVAPTPALVAQTDHTLTVLLPATDRGRVERLRDDVQRAAGEPVTAIVSDGAALEELPDVHRRARRGLQLMLTLGRAGTVARACELAPYAVLFGDSGRLDVEPFVDELLAPLIHSESRRSAQLVETLLTYFDCGRSTTDTAARLHIHVNTLRQRLDKITQLIPDWDAPERALDLHLALRLHALRATP